MGLHAIPFDSFEELFGNLIGYAHIYACVQQAQNLFQTTQLAFTTIGINGTILFEIIINLYAL